MTISEEEAATLRALAATEDNPKVRRLLDLLAAAAGRPITTHGDLIIVT